MRRELCHVRTLQLMLAQRLAALAPLALLWLGAAWFTAQAAASLFNCGWRFNPMLMGLGRAAPLHESAL
jgi:hypothetical protein